MKLSTIAITALSLLFSSTITNAEETRTINGVFRLGSPLVSRWQGECVGTKGLGDISGEMSVVIKDGKGEILAVGKTQRGQDTDNREICAFPFSVKNVPARNIYSIQVGQRNPVIFSAAELAEKKWNAEIAVLAFRR
jgi:hypothetical protein